uniref:Uncharacterized protein n=1 Tax=Rhizophora mucronata TaxID=61149 RepID=A0A2P2NNZ4_RHIMU
MLRVSLDFKQVMTCVVECNGV